MNPGQPVCIPGLPPRMRAEWRKFPDTAPRDREILVRGRWLPYGSLEGGSRCIVIAVWSTLRADDTEHTWISSLSSLDRMNVHFTEWTDVPD